MSGQNNQDDAAVGQAEAAKPAAKQNVKKVHVRLLVDHGGVAAGKVLSVDADKVKSMVESGVADDNGAAIDYGLSVDKEIYSLD